MTDEQTIKILKELLEVMLNDGDLQSASTVSHAIDLIERLAYKVDSLEWELDIMSGGLKYLETKAYEKFAERLLESKYESSDWSHGEHPYVVEESDIENLLYEPTEESNESE